MALAGQRGRSVLAIVAIAIGVTLGYAMHLIHSVAVDEMEQAARGLMGDADLVVQSMQGGMDESLYPRIARVPGVAVASPVVELDARVPGHDARLRLLGVDVFRAAEIQPAFVITRADALDALRPDHVFLNSRAAAWLGVSQGDRIVLQSGVALRELVVGGVVQLRGPPVAAMEISGVQEGFGHLGKLSRIDVRLASGVSARRIAEELARLLPAGVRVDVPEARAAQAAGFTRAYRVNLNVLALVALFTGGLLVFSSQSLAIVRRRSQLALLRALGVRRRELVGLLVFQGALLGSAGGLAGVAGGYGLAFVLLRLFGPNLGATYFRGVDARLDYEPVAAVLFVLLGALAAAVGSLAPAREAARTPPARALRAGGEEQAFARLGSSGPGMAMLVAGAASAWLPPVGGLPVFGYLAVALLLLGTIALLPRLTAGLARLLPQLRSPVAALASAQLRSAPLQVSISLAPLVASVAVAAAMAIMVGSFRDSLEKWLHQVLPADVYLRTGGVGDSAFLNIDGQRALSGLPGIARVEFARGITVSLSPGMPPVVLLARSMTAAQAEERLPLIGESIAPDAGAVAVWPSEVAAQIYGWRVGERIELPLGQKIVSATVSGIWRDYARGQGAIIMTRSDFIRATADDSANEAAVWLLPGVAAGEWRRRAQDLFPDGTVEAALPGELRAVSLALFDRTFAATYALEAAAVAVGLAGLSASFAAFALARRREFGVLRHLGMTRRQIGAMLAAQGALLAIMALAVGLLLGGVVSLVLIHVISKQSFHWSMDMSLPAGSLAAFSIMTVALAAAIALASARQAMRQEAVLAVKEDW